MIVATVAVGVALASTGDDDADSESHLVKAFDDAASTSSTTPQSRRATLVRRSSHQS